MSAFTHVTAGFWRWDGTDADHGFPIVGYAVSILEGLVLVDPPGTSGSVAEITELGNPVAIALTNQWHVRGAARWSREFGIGIYGPASAMDELRAEGAGLAATVGEGFQHSDWRAFRLRADDGEKAFDEVAYFDEKQRVLVVGDLLVDDGEGGVDLGPVAYSKMNPAVLHPILERLAALEPELLLSAHLGPRDDGAKLLKRLSEPA